MSNVIHLTTGGFEKVAQQDSPVLIDFWAPPSIASRAVARSRSPLRTRVAETEPRCGPCRMQGPILDQVSDTLGEKAIIAKINVDEEPRLAATFGVQSIPTLVVMKGGQIAKRWVGVQQAPTLVQALEAAGAR